MTAEEYLRWARPLFGLPPGSAAAPGSPAARMFLELPARLAEAAGAGHFLESSVSSTRGFERVKLALILEDGPAALRRDAARRDAPAKARCLEGLLRALEAAEGSYDARAAAGVLAALGRWGLRGSLMVSLDFERDRGSFGKLSLYGYLPGPDALPELLSPFGLSGLERAARPLAGPSLAFFGVDLPPRAPAALKLYNKTPFPDRALAGPAAEAAAALQEAGPLRDVTRLTRLGRVGTKAYLGYARGVPLESLARLRALGGALGWLARAARAAPGQRARFVGFQDGEAEVYFDRAGFGPAEDAAA